MLKHLFEWIADVFGSLLVHVDWAVQQADMRQWTIFAVAVVLIGFLCLKTRF